MNTILKTARRLRSHGSNQSSSVGVVRWNQPNVNAQAHSSAPSRPACNLTENSQQLHPRQNSLKDLRSLQECVQFIYLWKEQVDQVCTGTCDPEEGTTKRGDKSSDQHTERSLEQSKKLILEWAHEFHHVDQLLKETPWTSEGEGNREEEDANEEAQLRIMDWAKELQTVTESCGVQRDELGKLLLMLGRKKKQLVNLLPLLEFITWSLLKEDSTRMIPQAWLLAKQKTGKAGIPGYIPNSVWRWICSAKADVLLDTMTSHSWLQLSDDQRMVREGLSASDPPDNLQRFDSWPCVLGWEGYSSGRHYWEVDIANKGYWRMGVTTADSKRKGRFPMTPKQSYWVLWHSTQEFYACTKPETELPVGLVPQRMGIYLDYEEGHISFYNAATKAHIYTFTGTFKEKLYPLFAPLDGHTLLKIIPPQKISLN
ncbi:E3 ubiquitin-protein ligase TRIM39-like [Solea senegalensis]|nr:E3 ubiquitin-protein ligase TRIM69 isoform X1 [Solea senegalensis]KAG7496452.1 E3 ubiquitin-protein ligase TRIM39-like [Solea senegalensis]